MTSLADDYETLGEELLPRIIPAGEYTAEVTKAQYVTTGGGKHAIKITLRVTEGPEQGTVIFDQQTWSPESPVAARIFSQTLTRLGAPVEWIKTARPSWEEIAERILGSVVNITTTVRQFNGQDQANVSYRRLLNGQATPEAPPQLGAPAQQPQAQAQQQPAPLTAVPAPAASATEGGGFSWPSA